MNAPDPTPLEALRGDVEDAWHRFLDVYEGLRPDLYRYCRHLTRSPFEADDLVQDAMLRGFVALGWLVEPPPNPRAWLFHAASNLWIDRVRARRAPPEAAPKPLAAGEPRDLREAAGTLLSRLSPQERAAVVLKEAFDFSLEEIAGMLSTTPGTVKSALHRGRGKLLEDPPGDEPAPPRPQALDAFCAAFNARDLDRLTALLLDTAKIEVVPVHAEYGPEAARRGVFQGMMFGSRRLADPAQRPPGIDPERVVGILPEVPRCEARLHRGEWLALLWYAHADGEAVRAITRLEVEGDRIARVRNYFYTPEVLAEVCGELGVPFRSNGYRYWAPRVPRSACRTASRAR